MQKTFFKQLIAYSPSKLLPALTGFIVTPIVTRLFLPAEYGYWALAAGVADFLYALSCSGIGASTVRFYQTYKAESRLNVFFSTLVVTIGTAVIPVSLVSLVVIVVFKGHIPSALYPLMLISILIFAAQAVYNVLRGLLVAEGRSIVYSVFELATRYVSVGTGLLLVIVFGLGINGLLWGDVFVFTLAIPIVWFIATRGVRPSVQDTRLPEVSHLWRYALPLAIGNMAMWGLRLSDRYVISLFRSESEVGLYSVAYNLSGKSVDILAALFGLTMFPILMKVWETQGSEATEKTLSMFTRLYLIFGLPLTVGLAIFASPFVSIFASEAYHDGYRVVGYVAFSSLIWQLSQMASYGILIKKRTKQIAINQFVAAFVNLGLNFLLVPHFGYVVAGITTLIGFSILLGLQTYSSRNDLRWRFPWVTMRNTTLATLFMSLVALGIYGLSKDLMGLHVGLLLLSIVAAILVYFLSLWILGEANEVERDAVGSWIKHARSGLLKLRIRYGEE